MSWLDDVIAKVISVAGVTLPNRRRLNFSANFLVADNPATGATDVDFITASVGRVTLYAGTNPNAGGDSIAGTAGDILQSTGTFNGFAGWKALTTGTPSLWVPFGRCGQLTSKAISYQALATDRWVRVTDTSSARTITLPDVATIAPGFDLPIKDASFSNSSHDTTVSGHGGELIDGGASFTIPADGTGAGNVFTWNGTTWDVT